MSKRRAAAWAIVILIGGGLAGERAMLAQDQTPYQATRLIGRWRTIMNDTLEEGRAFAGEDVLDEMEIFVSPGAVRAVQDKLSEEQLKKADAVIERFAWAVVAAGQKQSNGSVVVDKAAIPAAERQVCPVYPFCAQ